MHPKTMMALAGEVEMDRHRERQRVERRAQARADRGAGSDGSRSASLIVRRLIAGLSLRPGLS